METPRITASVIVWRCCPQAYRMVPGIAATVDAIHRIHRKKSETMLYQPPSVRISLELLELLDFYGEDAGVPGNLIRLA